jgi:Uncharacterized protein conserved in bacteria (DUF2188)
MPERCRYYVVIHEGEWRIRFNGRHYGPYRTQAEAIQIAAQAACDGFSDGDDVLVMTRAEGNRFRTVWTYGKDPCPPPE